MTWNLLQLQSICLICPRPSIHSQHDLYIGESNAEQDKWDSPAPQCEKEIFTLTVQQQQQSVEDADIQFEKV